jgi:hypothetical protein
MCRPVAALPFQEYMGSRGCSVIGCYTEHRPFGEPTKGSIFMLPHRVTHAHTQALLDTLAVGVCVLLRWNAEGFCLGIGTGTWSMRHVPFRTTCAEVFCA